MKTSATDELKGTIDKGTPQGANGQLDQAQINWLRHMPDGWDGTAPTLGGGKLTAEQVRECIERHFGKVAVLDDGKPVEWRDDLVCKVAIDYKGIADELNAALGNNTCSGQMTYNGWFVCDSCGCQTQGDSYGEVPNYCSNCGKRCVHHG